MDHPEPILLLTPKEPYASRLYTSSASSVQDPAPGLLFDPSGLSLQAPELFETIPTYKNVLGQNMEIITCWSIR